MEKKAKCRELKEKKAVAICSKNYWHKLGKDIWNQRYLYLLLLPGMIVLLLFRYRPMAGLQLAFKTYNAQLGFWGSPFNEFANFKKMFVNPEFMQAFRNTIIISAGRLLIEFPVPIILAIMLAEMRFNRLKKVYQTLFTFPNFLSWVVVGSILTTFFGAEGPMNSIITSLGGESIGFLSNSDKFRWFLYLTDIWKSAGWTCIIYVAAIAGIDPGLYEAASIDGAGRLRRIWHITLTGLRPTILIMFILQVGKLMEGGFDQIFNLYNASVYSVADILDTYVYRATFVSVPDYGFSTAVGLVKSLINLVLVVAANQVTKIISDDGHGALLG